VKKKKLVCGVGINDADYIVMIKETIGYENGKQKQKFVWICPFYSRWRLMIQRCYSVKYQEKFPTYKGCFVCKEWLTFSKFRQWMQNQDWGGKQLDKDILVPGNKVYSPDTCVFVEKRVNVFLTESTASRGQHLIGASLDKTLNKFHAYCNDGSGKKKHLGLFDTELEAHKAWLAFKLEQAKILAAEQSDPRVAKALIERYENYVIEEH
jgi:hypothetical protein